jgi:hypothetical protein
MNLENKSRLERFIIDNEDLERLESLLDQFNIFEAVGMVRQEVRHSNFLAFLINPAASHRLGDLFLKGFFKRLLIDASNAPISPIDIDIADLADTQVRREWKNIDLLCFSPESKIVCAIENKVDSGEHSNQLQRYRNTVAKEFKDYHQIFAFLTPKGVTPHGEDDQKYWLPYSYAKIADLIDDLSKRYQSTIGSEVYVLMKHYSSLIKRHLMGDSEIAQLCQKIYLQHKAALDLIYEHRPDLESDILEAVKNMVENTASSKVILNHVFKSAHKSVGFVVPAWDDMAFQKTCKKWTSTKRILIFEIKLHLPNINLYLTLGPGELANRTAVFEALDGQDIPGFVGQRPEKETGWICLLKRAIAEDVSPDTSIADVSQEIEHFWQQFLANELPLIDQAITQGLS